MQKLRMTMCYLCANELAKDGREVTIVEHTKRQFTCRICGNKRSGALYEVSKGVKK